MANVNVFLTGGAMRDMIAGFRIRDLDFVVEGSALKVAKAICDKTGAHTLSTDDNRKTAEIVFPSGVTAQIGMSRQEKYARVGAKPQVAPATIQEDLRGRDFTCNAIALSLNRASRGLLLDPMNGLADIERKELRAVTTYGFYDDPTRLLRLVRFKVRLGFTIEERTQMQIANAREAEVEKRIPGKALGEELKRISTEDNPTDILNGLEEAGLLVLFSPVLFAKLNTAGLGKLEKAYHVLPDDARWRAARWGTFLHCLTEKLFAEGEAGADQDHRTFQKRRGPVAEDRGAREEVGGCATLAEDSQALACLPHRGGGASGGRAVRALPLGRQARAGAPPESLPEVSAHGAGDHGGGMGDDRGQAGDAEVHEGARGFHQ